MKILRICTYIYIYIIPVDRCFIVYSCGAA